MICSGCNNEIEIGDRYIVDTASGFLGQEANPKVDELVAMVLGDNAGKIVFCEDCTTDGGDYMWETNYDET